jgi:hypothetical protein
MQIQVETLVAEESSREMGGRAAVNMSMLAVTVSTAESAVDKDVKDGPSQ